ncbi:peptidyl-prolyl cis-trans isomerase [Thermovibrio sp.]
MRKLLAVSLLLFLAGCSSPSKKETSQVEKAKPVKERVCSDSTVLATGRGIEITLADYKYTLTLLNPKAKEFFKEHPVDLLRRMVNRRLVVLYAKDSGLAKRYGLEKEMEDFKKEYLSREFVSIKAKSEVKPITKEEVVKRFKELFPNKDPDKMSKADEDFIRNELKVKEFDRAVASIYREVEKKTKVKKEGDKLVVECCGIKVEGKGPESALKEELYAEYFYRQALKEGLDKSPDFRRMYTEYFATKAVELFRKELLKKIKITDDEVKEYYEKHKSEFKMPARVKAVVFYFSDKKRAEEAKKLLEEGRPWKKVAYRFGQFNAKEKTYFKDTKDPIGVALFAIDEGKERKPIIIALSQKKYALIYPIKFIPEGELPLSEVKRFVALKVKEGKLREAEKEKLKELWKKYGIKLENLDCIKGGA